jgi:hypothetical protein
MIKEEMMPAFQGIIPSPFSTSSKDREPNVSYVSQVYYVDEKHVAISNQFFNKSMRNIRECEKACVNVSNPQTFNTWNLQLKYVRSETDGPLFEEMKDQLEAIASMSGMEDVFVLHAAEVFEITRVDPLYASLD